MHFYKHSITFHITESLAVFWVFSSRYDWNSIILQCLATHETNLTGIIYFIFGGITVVIFSGGSLDDLCLCVWISSLG